MLKQPAQLAAHYSSRFMREGVAGIREAGPVSWTRDEFAPGLALDYLNGIA